MRFLNDRTNGTLFFSIDLVISKDFLLCCGMKCLAEEKGKELVNFVVTFFALSSVPPASKVSERERE